MGVTKRTMVAAAVLVLATGAAACSSDDDDTATTSSSAAEVSTTAPTTDDTADAMDDDAEDGDAAGSSAFAGIAVGSTTDGQILVAGGLPVYAFDRDTPERSSCVDDCATAWPAVPADVEIGPGVSVTTGSITRSDGTEQLTVNGAPVYTFSGDAPLAAADGSSTAAGQGVGGVWWVVAVDGNPIRAVAGN